MLRNEKGSSESPAVRVCNAGVTEPAPCSRREEGRQISFIPWVFLAVEVYLSQRHAAEEEMLYNPSQRLCQINCATNTHGKRKRVRLLNHFAVLLFAWAKGQLSSWHQSRWWQKLEWK